jgi:hypothetical protein
MQNPFFKVLLLFGILLTNALPLSIKGENEDPPQPQSGITFSSGEESLDENKDRDVPERSEHSNAEAYTKDKTVSFAGELKSNELGQPEFLFEVGATSFSLELLVNEQ